MNDLEKLWKSVLSELEIQISKAEFNTWLGGVFIIDIKDKVVYLAVPNGFAKNHISKKYYDDILTLIRKDRPEIEKLELKVTSLKNQLPDEIQQNIEAVQINTQKRTGPKKFKSKYTFDNFIVGESNKLAHAASLAVSEKPGKRYNPLFIWGGVGLGKTHLMNAIGNAISTGFKNKKTIYVSSETFMNDYISAIKKGEGKAEDFKNHYRNVDALLIDDIQFLAGKMGTQEEFFHTFNALHQKNKQIVMTSDRPPKAIDMEDRLKSRCEWGMIVDISSPDFETRCAILRSKADILKFTFPDEVINYIAENVSENIRELEGALNRLIAYLDLYKKEPTKENVGLALTGVIKPKNPSLDYDKVIDVVIKYFSIDKNSLLGSSRTRDVVYPRQILMYLLKNELNISNPQIAKMIGKKDHTTIMHGTKKIEAEIKNNPTLQNQVTDIKKLLYE